MAFFCVPCKVVAFSLQLLLTCGSLHASSYDLSYACGPAYAHFPFCNRALSIQSRVSDLLSHLSLEEKIDQLVSSAANISRLGIPAYYWWSEALHGLSDNGPGVRFGDDIPAVTIFPQVILSIASFNRTLWNLIAQV
ncbi:hypothetical protein L7F22_048238 [Adiantum nelumboides]|nr:hypothetical protein [Adiantum nelumboides]